jgi:hypothetical protein
MIRLQLPSPAKAGAASHSTAARPASTATTPSASRTRNSSSRSAETSIISAKPAGTAAARTESGQPSAGVSIKDWSCMYSNAGPISMARSRSGVRVASASAQSRPRGGKRMAMVVSRMCSPFHNASTAPSMASQRKTMEASSSLQVSG